MDAKARKDERRRCCECERKYKPEAAAHKHQKTCCREGCRRRRRARQARERYWAAPLVSRDAACKRKRKARDKRPGGRACAAEGESAVASVPATLPGSSLSFAGRSDWGSSTGVALERRSGNRSCISERRAAVQA
jgi:hypothetical protein